MKDDAAAAGDSESAEEEVDEVKADILTPKSVPCLA